MKGDYKKRVLGFIVELAFLIFGLAVSLLAFLLFAILMAWYLLLWVLPSALVLEQVGIDLTNQLGAVYLAISVGLVLFVHKILYVNFQILLEEKILSKKDMLLRGLGLIGHFFIQIAIAFTYCFLLLNLSIWIMNMVESMGINPLLETIGGAVFFYIGVYIVLKMLDIYEKRRRGKDVKAI